MPSLSLVDGGGGSVNGGGIGRICECRIKPMVGKHVWGQFLNGGEDNVAVEHETEEQHDRQCIQDGAVSNAFRFILIRCCSM